MGSLVSGIEGGQEVPPKVASVAITQDQPVEYGPGDVIRDPPRPRCPELNCPQLALHEVGGLGAAAAVLVVDHGRETAFDGLVNPSLCRHADEFPTGFSSGAPSAAMNPWIVSTASSAS